jgi:tRNA modification GTPase
VLRISGPQALEAARALGCDAAAPRQATRVRLTAPESKEPLDDGLMLWFPAPASFTGEDVVELHLHGGLAVIAGVVGALAACPGLRAAAPGEFTRRAFENGKLELTQVEGLADLVNAETAAQRRQALRQLGGDFGARCEAWRGSLLRCLGHLEAEIDFVDDDLPSGLIERGRDDVSRLRAEIAGCLDDSGGGERLREGAYVVILGAPNVGKSSLLNRLAGRAAAIVSARAGTTRDVIEVQLDLGGYPVTVADTAGLRAAGDEIESEGVRRATARAEVADLKLIVGDASASEGVVAVGGGGAELVVWNKADLVEGPRCLHRRPGIEVSALTGAGVEALIGAIGALAAERLAEGALAAITRSRHRQALEDCVASLERAGTGVEVELMAEDVRLAVRALGRITGRVDVEDLLDVVFAELCIGK